jgi:hypothetical protein
LLYRVKTTEKEQPPMRKTKYIPVTLPIHAAIKQRAQIAGLSISAYLDQVLTPILQQRPPETDSPFPPSTPALLPARAIAEALGCTPQSITAGWRGRRSWMIVEPPQRGAGGKRALYPTRTDSVHKDEALAAARLLIPAGRLVIESPDGARYTLEIGGEVEEEHPLFI